MAPSLDIFSFGMVALFLFSERSWWGNADQSSSKPSQSLTIESRERCVRVLIAEIEGLSVLQKIARQICEMVDADAKRRPEAKDCSFELCAEYHVCKI